MQHFVTIANRQINTLYILAVEGCQEGQTGNIKLYLDPLAGGLLNGSGIKLKAESGVQTMELTGDSATAFRKEWIAIDGAAPATSGKTHKAGG